MAPSKVYTSAMFSIQKNKQCFLFNLIDCFNCLFVQVSAAKKIMLSNYLWIRLKTIDTGLDKIWPWRFRHVLAPLRPRFGPVMAESFCVRSLRVGMGYPRVIGERLELTRGRGLVTLKKSAFRNMMTLINVSSFFYDPLKLED